MVVDRDKTKVEIRPGLLACHGVVLKWVHHCKEIYFAETPSAESALYRGYKHRLTQVDEGKRCCIILAIEKKGRTVAGRGQKSLLGDPGLSYV